eukprot:gene2040-2511_t
MKFLFFLYLFFIFVNSEVFENPDNLHTYEIVIGDFKWTEAQAQANTLGGYLATITTYHEHLFVQKSFSQYGGSTNKRLWIGASGILENNNVNYYWTEGPEKDLLMYSRVTGKCYGFCPWNLENGPSATFDSTTSQYNRYVLLDSGNFQDGQNSHPNIYGFILEKNPLAKPKEIEPVFIPTDTDDDTVSFKIPNLSTQYNVIGLKINFLSLSLKTNFSCTHLSSTSDTYTCKRPHMSGFYDIVLNDTTNPANYYVIKNVHPRVPYVSTVTPKFTKNDEITINGQSFGGLGDKVNVLYGLPTATCVFKNYIVPHRSFVCTLDNDVSSQVMYIYVIVESVLYNPSKRFALFNSETKNILYLPLNTYTDTEITNYYIEGKKLEWYTPAYQSDANMLKRWSARKYCIQSLKQGDFFLVPNGPFIRNSMISMISSTCVPGGIPGCQSIDSSLQLSTPYPLSYDIGTGIFYGVSQMTPIVTCTFPYNFYLANKEAPYFGSRVQYLVSPSGEDIYISMNGLGMTSSVYEIYLDGQKIELETPPVPHFYPFVSKNQLKVRIPPLIGSAVPKNLEISVDSIKTSPNNPNTLGYFLPIPQLFRPEANIATIGNDLIELEAVHLSMMIDDIKVLVAFGNGKEITIPPTQIIVPYKKISFKFPRGTGKFNIFLNVGGQKSAYGIPGSYASPLIDKLKTSIQINTSQATLLNLFGKNFGNGSYVKLLVNGVDCPTDIYNSDQINDSYYSFILPDVLKKGVVQFSVDTLNSNSVPFDLPPILFNVTPIPIQGGKITINGRYMADTSVVRIGSNIFTTGFTLSPNYQQITFTVGPGTDLRIPISVNNGIESSPVMLNYGPFISQCKMDSSQSLISIIGSGFDEGSEISFGSDTKPVITIESPQLIIYPIQSTLQNFYTTITSNGIKSNSVFTKNIVPIITNVIQVEDSITINGQNFGEDINLITVELNSVPLNCIFVNIPRIKCNLVETSTSGLLVVSVSGLTDSQDFIIRPFILPMTPYPSNSTLIKIGAWFLFGDSENGEFSANVGLTQCTSVTKTTPTEIECELPPDSDANTGAFSPQVSIIFNSLPSINSVVFTYTKPSISYITQNFSTIIIVGNTLGNNQQMPTVHLGVFSEELLCSFSKQQTELVCNLSLDSRDGFVRVNNYLGLDELYIYLNPVLMSIIGVAPPTLGGVVYFQTALIKEYVSAPPLPEFTTIGFNHYLSSEILVDDPIKETIKCRVPENLPTNSPVILTLMNRKSQPIIFNYDIPKPIEYTQINPHTLQVKGVNFGSIYFVTLENNVKTSCNVVNDSIIECDFKSMINHIKNGPAIVSREGINSNSFRISLEPSINKVSNAPVNGGIITVDGNLFNFVDSQGSTLSSTVSTSVGDCVDVKPINSSRILCSIPKGSSGLSNSISITIDGKQSNSFSFSAKTPIIEQAFGENLFYGKGGMITVIGSEFTSNNLKIMVEAVECTSPVFFNSEKLQCLFDGSVQQRFENEIPIGLKVTVNSDGVIGSSDVLIYDRQDDNCGNLSPECSGNGECISGKCFCSEGYNGVLCQNKNNETNPTGPIDNNPNNSTFPWNFAIFFSHIREVNLNGQVVVTYPISDVQWNITSNNSNIIESVGKIPNTDITLNVWSKLFTDSETLYFGGESLIMENNTLKYQITVKGWKPQLSLNRIELIYVLNSPSIEEFGCITEKPKVTVDNIKNIRWITIKLGDKLFTSKFSQRVIIDSRTSVTSTKLLDQSDPIFKDSFFTEIKSTENTNQVVVSISFSVFNEFATIDPDYSLLINPGEIPKGECKNKKSYWWISLIVVGGVGLAGVAVDKTYCTSNSIKISGKNKNPLSHKPLKDATSPQFTLKHNPSDYFKFEVIHQSSKSGARVTKITTPNGVINTPNFVPVATVGSIKFLDPLNVRKTGSQLMFVNTYHMLLNSNLDLIEKMGGLHKFINYQGPIITDSGGFQVFSMGHPERFGQSGESATKESDRLFSNMGYSETNQEEPTKRELKGMSGKKYPGSIDRITDKGVEFRSYVNGQQFTLTPSSSVQYQKKLGADIIIPFDELPPYHISDHKVFESLNRTHHWEAESLITHLQDPRQQAMYSVIHGGVSLPMRKISIKYLTSLPFDGVAIGGSLGKDRQEMKQLMSEMMPLMPYDKPNHLLGIGDIESITDLVPLGVDSFDSSYPTRAARHGLILMSDSSNILIKKPEFGLQFDQPLENGCNCSTCTNYSRAYIHHLFKSGEQIYFTLATQHNLTSMARIMENFRNKILANEI